MSSLAVLVDTSACAWGAYAAENGGGSKAQEQRLFARLIRTVVAFCNAHLSLSASNRLTLYAYARGVKTKLLYDSIRSPSPDASSEMVRTLRVSLAESARSGDNSMAPPLAATLAVAICHLRKCASSSPHAGNGTGGGNGEVAAAGGAGAPSASALFSSSSGRVLLLSLSTHFGAQHSLLMNLFFAAAKQHTNVTVVSLVGGSALLQQATDITSGLFIDVAHPEQLPRMLMTQCLAPPSQDLRMFWKKTKSSSSESVTVDYRAACFCHQTLVSSGWVCSVCLTVLCQFMPICPACGSVFKISALPRRNRKRRVDGTPGARASPAPSQTTQQQSYHSIHNQ